MTSDTSIRTAPRRLVRPRASETSASRPVAEPANADRDIAPSNPAVITSPETASTTPVRSSAASTPTGSPVTRRDSIRATQ